MVESENTGLECASEIAELALLGSSVGDQGRLATTLIITESYFGNVLTVASSISEGLLRSGILSKTVRSEENVRVEGYGLYIFGLPTHALGSPNTFTRREAARRGGMKLARGVVEFFDEHCTQLERCSAAVFATGTGKRFGGSATRAVVPMLRANGLKVIDENYFLTQGTRGPLCDGEVVRAHEWGSLLALAL